MKSIKAILLGMPSRELKEYIPVISRVKKGVLSEEESYQMSKLMKKNVMLKFISLPISVSVGYFIPVPPDFTSPLLAKIVASFFSYRILTVPYTMHTFEYIKEIVNKYDLRNNPELLNPSRIERAKEINDRITKEYEEEMAKKKEGEPKETYEEFIQKKEDNFEKLVMEYQAEMEQKKEEGNKETFRQFLDRKKKEQEQGIEDKGENKKENKGEDKKENTEEKKD
ncbi:unnamed protein product [Blepharisma stoltei]|uniref:Uncharacterized protein n=1 Tax=Blepharisma stoltei TaxID=1481888 RepID=A0AAU9JPB2_9CILI|nr:unnamed protein product [Blepharisma stoltei]